MKNIIELVVYLIGTVMLVVGVGLFVYGMIDASFAINHNVGLIVTGLLFYLIGYKTTATLENSN